MSKFRKAEVRRERGDARKLPPGLLLSIVLSMAFAITASAQDKSPSMDIYGFAMMDMGFNFRTINPDWFDTMRVTKLPSFEGEFGKNYSTFAGVRQTRFGVKAAAPTSLGELKTIFEFEMFGVGVDEGQTTFRLRHAYGEVGKFGAGQTWSPFMDPDVFPNSLEYWGPTGMVFYRNVQFRWMPLQGKTNVTIALERPGASGDSGRLADRIELSDISPRFALPDLTGQFTHGTSWGYIRAAGVVRRINWDDNLADVLDLGGHVTGWGVNVSSNINIGPDNKKSVVKLQAVYGKGIENYMNDAPVDVGIVANPGDPALPIKGQALRVYGIVAFLDQKWNDKWSSSMGYSIEDIKNSDLQLPIAFRKGQYALANLLYYPVPNVMLGGELQWGRRDNFSDGFHYDDYKLQFSFKYNFSHKIGG